MNINTLSSQDRKCVKLQNVFLGSDTMVLMDTDNDTADISIKVKSEFRFKKLLKCLEQVNNYKEAKVFPDKFTLVLYGLSKRSYIYIGCVEHQWVQWMTNYIDKRYK
jgi:hypothetical protein